MAADIAGIGVRTLQRRLRTFHLTCIDLVHQAQFEYTVELLKDPDLRTLDIAYSAGYHDTAKFSRALRRITGISPKEYRNQYLFS